jgi:hypothetical protein
MLIANNLLFFSKKNKKHSLLFISNNMKNKLNMNGVNFIFKYSLNFIALLKLCLKNSLA